MIFREAQKKIPLFFPFLLPFAVVKYSAIDNSAECGTVKCTWRQLVTNSNQHGGSVKKIIGSVDHEVRGESIWVKRPSAWPSPYARVSHNHHGNHHHHQHLYQDLYQHLFALQWNATQCLSREVCSASHRSKSGAKKLDYSQIFVLIPTNIFQPQQIVFSPNK